MTRCVDRDAYFALEVSIMNQHALLLRHSQCQDTYDAPAAAAALPAQASTAYWTRRPFHVPYRL